MPETTGKRFAAHIHALVFMVIILVSWGFVSPTQAQDTTAHPDHILMTPEDYVWSDAPASIPPGARVMVIEGDPAVAGAFTMRLWMPANYVISPHFHPADEHVTVISGSFYMGMGDTCDKDIAKRLPPGSFAMMKKGTRHFAFTKEETVVQLHGVGPWGLTYVNPDDDPRNQSE